MKRGDCLANQPIALNRFCSDQRTMDISWMHFRVPTLVIVVVAAVVLRNEGGGTLLSHWCAVDRESNGVLIFVMRFMSQPGKSAKLLRVLHVSKITLSNLLLFSLILECAQLDSSTCPPVAGCNQRALYSVVSAGQLMAEQRRAFRREDFFQGFPLSVSSSSRSFRSVLLCCRFSSSVIGRRFFLARFPQDLTSHYSTQQTASSSSYKRMHICDLETALREE